jgi:hypothetical protein
MQLEESAAMTQTFDSKRKPAILALCLTLGLLGEAHAQMTSGPGLTSGSGAGTGSGASSGIQRNRSGSLSGVGPGPAGGDSLRGSVQPPGTRARRPLTSFGPGVDVTYPNDPYLLPFMELEQPGATFDRKAPTRITNELLKSARLITSPEERSLALQRLASGAIASRQLFMAHQLLEEATTATSEVTIPLVRDQRLIAIVTSMSALTDAMLLQGRQILNESASLEGEGRAEPLPKGATDPNVLIRTSRLEWQRAVYLAELIGNPTYRNEMMYKVAESMASGSASIANEYVRAAPNPALSPSPGVAPPAAPAPKRADPRPADGQPRSDVPAKPKSVEVEAFRKTADAILIDSFGVAKKIDRLIWKYRAMVRIALLAADSEQYSRGFDLARGIQNGESRAEAMLLLAEAQTRDNQNEGATASYEEAAKAVATVQQDGLRGVLAGFVVDSLNASGRFEDARKCTVLYPNQAQRMVALGAIAESQGRRGAAESARRWIAAEVPEHLRPILYRRVTTGVLAAIEQNRSKEFIPSDLP